MSENKSLLLEIAEVIDRRFQRKARAGEPTPRPGRPGRFLRWMVPNGGTLLLILVLILTQQVWARPASNVLSVPGPSATTVNYQGRLADPAGNPLDGTYGMSFSLWDSSSGGTLVWGPENHTAVPVSNGLFSVGLGSATSGGIPTNVWDGDRYLEIAVGGETLAPRELLRSVPIAGMALTVPDGVITTGKLADGAVTQAKAPSLVEAHLPNTLMQYGMVTAVATAQTNILQAEIDFVPDFPVHAYVLFTPEVNETFAVIVTFSGACTDKCTVNIYRTDGGAWSPGQIQNVMWFAVRER